MTDISFHYPDHFNFGYDVVDAIAAGPSSDGGLRPDGNTLLLANFRGHSNIVGSLGFSSPLYRVELRRADGSAPVPGEIGEIVVVPKDSRRPLGLFTGYLGDAPRYENAWSGGVYHTGDAAWQDERGCFFFHGRFDDLIKTGGFRVGPSEVENILMEHESVLECAVVGIPDPSGARPSGPMWC